MQQGWRDLWGLFLFPPFLRAVLVHAWLLATLLRWQLSSPKPTQERQLTGARSWDQQSFVFCTASYSWLPLARKASLMCIYWEEECSTDRTRTRSGAKARPPREGWQRSISQPSCPPGQRQQEKPPLRIIPLHTAMLTTLRFRRSAEGEARWVGVVFYSFRTQYRREKIPFLEASGFYYKATTVVRDCMSGSSSARAVSPSK